MVDWHVLPLEDCEFARAYPLVRSVARVDLAHWLRFARALTAGPGGVIGARAGRDCLYGIAAFMPKASLQHGKILEVEVLAAFSLGRGPHARLALRDELRRIAKVEGCRGLTYTGEARERGEPIYVPLEDVAAPSEQRNGAVAIARLE